MTVVEVGNVEIALSASTASPAYGGAPKNPQIYCTGVGIAALAWAEHKVCIRHNSCLRGFSARYAHFGGGRELTSTCMYE